MPHPIAFGSHFAHEVGFHCSQTFEGRGIKLLGRSRKVDQRTKFPCWLRRYGALENIPKNHGKIHHAFSWVNPTISMGHFHPFSSSQTVNVISRGYCAGWSMVAGSDDKCSFRQATWALMDYGRFGRQSMRRDLTTGGDVSMRRLFDLPMCLWGLASDILSVWFRVFHRFSLFKGPMKLDETGVKMDPCWNRQPWDLWNFLWGGD